jgi:hypothetical protein
MPHISGPRWDQRRAGDREPALAPRSARPSLDHPMLTRGVSRTPVARPSATVVARSSRPVATFDMVLDLSDPNVRVRDSADARW